MAQEVIEITEREIEIIEVIERGPVGQTGPQPNINYEVVTSSRTVSSRQLIAADTSGGAFTLTLPLNPSNGDAVDIFDFSETFDTNPLTIARNGSRIESLEDNLICNVEGAYFTLIYTGSTRGWQVLPRYGTSGGGGESTLTTQGDMLYRGPAVNTRLPIGTAGQVLKVNSGATAPEWGTISTAPSGAAGGDLTGTYPNPTLAASGASAGTYTKVTVDTKGRVTVGATATPTDIGAVPTSRSISSGTGLTGGGDLTANRTLAVSYGTTAGTAAEGNHTHAAADITSGTLDNARVNFAAPSAIGGTTPAAGNFSTIRVDPKNGGTGSLAIGSTTGSEADQILLNINGITLRSQGGNQTALIARPSSLSTNRTYQLPNADGTIALTSDITGGIDDYTVITSSQTVTNGARIAADTTAGAFTVTLPATPSNGDTIYVLDYAGTFDTNNLTIDRNGSNIESLAENMDANIEDAAFSLVYVGSTIGWKVVPYFGSSVNFSSPNAIGNSVPSTGAFTTLTATTLQNTPIGNTGASTGAFTTLSATATITGQLGATVGSTSAAAIAVGHANSGIYVNSNQIIFTKQGVECMFFDNSSRVNVNTTGGLQVVQTDAPIIFSRAISLFPDAANGTLAQRSGTQAQTFRIYNTFTSATNFERCNIIAQSAGSVIIGTEKGSGGGTARGMELRTDNVSRINISATGGIGFFGAAAAAQPTAVADATDAATVITQLNALLLRMRALGLIAP